MDEIRFALRALGGEDGDMQQRRFLMADTETPGRRRKWAGMGLAILSAAMGMLTGCASKKNDPRLTDFPEPRGKGEEAELWEKPSSHASRARLGDTDALHATFARVLDLEQEGAGSFQYDIRSLRDALGDERFFAALARESAEVQQKVAPFAPR